MYIDIDLNDIDVESLKNDLINYYGSATPIEPFAMADLVSVDTNDVITLLKLMEGTNLNIVNYLKGESLRKVINHE